MIPLDIELASELQAMIRVYSAELREAWLRGTPPRQVKRICDALGGARECLALVMMGPQPKRHRSRHARSYWLDCTWGAL